jgi:predicted RNA-binding Zn-ribbon protein involved in translation (DUF1610 family)
MRMNRAKRGCIIIAILIVMLCFLSISSVTAEESGGPKVISGQVYKSNGKAPRMTNDEDYTGTEAKVIVLHNGVKSTYKDHNGLEFDSENLTYWYAVTIPQGAWEEGDTYWIWVEGSAWGDMDFTCTAHNDQSVNSWSMDASGAEWRNVDTADYNFKPMIAWIFALILGIMGIIIGIFRPLKLPASGWPRQQADLRDEIIIVGTAEIPVAAPAAVPAAAPAAAAPPAAPAETRTCAYCNGPLEYIKEYDKWYCYSCKKYEKKETPPPPEEETAPTPAANTCASCGGPLEYIEEYDRWYCHACGKYAAKDTPGGA